MEGVITADLKKAENFLENIEAQVGPLHSLQPRAPVPVVCLVERGTQLGDVPSLTSAMGVRAVQAAPVDALQGLRVQVPLGQGRGGADHRPGRQVRLHGQRLPCRAAWTRPWGTCLRQGRGKAKLRQSYVLSPAVHKTIPLPQPLLRVWRALSWAAVSWACQWPQEQDSLQPDRNKEMAGSRQGQCYCGSVSAPHFLPPQRQPAGADWQGCVCAQRSACRATPSRRATATARSAGARAPLARRGELHAPARG